MPYINEDLKERARVAPESCGELTFAIQQMLKEYVGRQTECYDVYAECIAALHGAELDLWDRKLRDYEHAKCEQNGDVW